MQPSQAFCHFCGGRMEQIPLASFSIINGGGVILRYDDTKSLLYSLTSYINIYVWIFIHEVKLYNSDFLSAAIYITSRYLLLFLNQSGHYSDAGCWYSRWCSVKIEMKSADVHMSPCFSRPRLQAGREAQTSVVVHALSGGSAGETFQPSPIYLGPRTLAPGQVAEVDRETGESVVPKSALQD